MSRNIKRVPLDFEHTGTWPGYEADDRYDPPAGDGWQMWEDVSEGSPISPVFATSGELADWIVNATRENGESDYDCSPEAAHAFIAEGWCPTGYGTAFGFYTGMQMAAGLATHLEWLERRNGFEPVPAGTAVTHLATGIAGTVVHIIPKDCIGGTDDRFYLIEWERGLPSLLEDGDDPAAPMESACRTDGFTPAEPEGDTP